MLTDKIALVTGASRGIGKEVAIALAKEGAFVIVNYYGSTEKANQVVNEIIAQGNKAVAYQCDVSDFAACEKMIAELIRTYKKVDILVNNAGITKDGLIMKMTESDFVSVIDTNLLGTFHTIRHLSRYFLKQRSGKIINMASVSGILGNPGQANYSASKAGVIGLTKSVARELASRGINVNAVAPGFIATEMTDAMTEEAKAKIKDAVPLGRMGTTEDIANMVVFLASDKSDYITGQTFTVDGGMAI